MTSDAARLFHDARTLSEDDRAELAARLIESLDGETDEDADAAWDREIAQRVQELDEGKVKPVPWDEARRAISERLRTRRDD